MRIGFMTAAASTSCATNRQQKTARESRRRRASAALLCVHPSDGTGATLSFPAPWAAGAQRNPTSRARAANVSSTLCRPSRSARYGRAGVGATGKVRQDRPFLGSGPIECTDRSLRGRCYALIWVRLVCSFEQWIWYSLCYRLDEK